MTVCCAGWIGKMKHTEIDEIR